MCEGLSKMVYLEMLLLVYAVVTFSPGYCKTESSSNDKGLPKFLSELDLSNMEADSAETLKRIVKRLAPEKNGEYQVYQVFFGNADLLKEWLKGAGVNGQPGVDFPALTSIPATSFTCRGMKGGYYADLETNCQVFHICDNGRKISFLCPNGTIFQQSQLICDWWFKVDCSKSVELYEQSSEQLAEEERKRTESRKSKLEYHRQVETGNPQDYYDVQNTNYDGKQNGRISPYDEPPQQNQLQSNRDRVKPARQFENKFFNQETSTPRNENQFFGTSNSYQQSQSSGYKPQFNQYNSYEDSSKYTTVSQDYYGTSKKAQNYLSSNRNSNAPRDEKNSVRRQKQKILPRTSSSSPIQRVTPTYTESTTFRGSSTNQIKESQQFAESAAFVSNRGNRYNENNGNPHQFYYQLYSNRDANAADSNRDEPESDNIVSTQRNDYSSFTDTGFTPDYRQRTTISPYETTTQYTITAAPPCNTEHTTTEASTVVTHATPPTTESFVYDNYDSRERLQHTETRNPLPDVNYHGSTNSDGGNGATVTDSPTTSVPETFRTYETTENYQENSATPYDVNDETVGKYTTPPTTSSFSENNFRRSESTQNVYDNQYNKGSGKYPSTSQAYRQNSLSTTEKPFKSTQAYQQSDSTKDLSPYDRSFTYKQGKVMSTLGPYIPFTRNYAYTASTTSTPKPTTYTATVPTYNPVTSSTHSSVKSLIPKLKDSGPSSNKIRASADQVSEREHALSMLHSLRGLENHVPDLNDLAKTNERPDGSASGPSTLHSLALYFSTATDTFDSNETTDPAVSEENYKDDKETRTRSGKSNTTIEVPSSLLTQHTIASYAELFKLNNALETNNVTKEDRFDAATYNDDYNDDLDIQQSGGSLDDARKANGTKLRELAQVFTHALSAYLLDPDTFKKVLTEIRPTEPPKTTIEPEDFGTTTPYPMTDEDYVSIREKDEVLDFSEDVNELAKQKLTTVYPTPTPAFAGTETIYEGYSTVATNYYTNPTTQETTDAEIRVSTNPPTNTYFETSAQPTESSFTYEQNGADGNTVNNIQDQSSESDKAVATQVYNNYYSSNDVANRNKVGGFQNNSVSIVTASYGNTRPFGTTPISSNYVSSSTPPPRSHSVHPVSYNWGRRPTSKKPEQQLTPPLYENYRPEGQYYKKHSEFVTPDVPSSFLARQKIRATTSLPGRSYDTNNEQPYRIRYNKATNSGQKVNDESLVTARTSYIKFQNNYNRLDNYNAETTERPLPTTTIFPTRMTDPVTTSTSNAMTTTPYANTDYDSVDLINQKEAVTKLLNDNHWTSSPAVTQLWETSVFVDPKRINHGLESEPSTFQTTTDLGVTERIGRTEPSTPIPRETFSTLSESLTDDPSFSTPWQRLSRDKDAPTAFTLLPTAFSPDHTVTPKPLITTRSSITTTITSSVTSTNAIPSDGLVPSLLPFPVAPNLNETENEIAEKIFGNLNETSASTLMRVMKQADSNETVRQLVLLLISHCNEPMNKTMQREKEQLLNDLLRMPVNEFTSDESKNVVAEINRLNTPRTRFVSEIVRTRSTSPTLTEPPVTTFRSRKSRRYRTTTENSANIARRSEKETQNSPSVFSRSEKVTENTLTDDDTTASDNRALELLRSLYTIATKWG